MNSVDDLCETFERYSERGEARGAQQVLGAARAAGSDRVSPRWPVAALVAAVAVVCVAVSVVVVQRRSDEVNVITAPPAASTSSTTASVRSLAPVTVPGGGSVSKIAAAFGRIWVATVDLDTPSVRSHLRSFDPATGKLISEDTVVGHVYALVFTDNYVWVRATSGGPASFPVENPGQGDNAVYRVDPKTGAATPVRYLNGDGPFTATGSRIAAADFFHIEVVGEDGLEIASATIDEAVGVANASFPGANGITGLAFARSAPPMIFAVHEGRRELLQLDPTARHMATHRFDDNGGRRGPAIAAADDRVWVAEQTVGVTGVEIPLGSPEPVEVHLPVPIPAHQVEVMDGGRLLVGSSDDAVVINVETGVVTRTPFDPGSSVSVLTVNGQPWAAHWLSPPTPTPTLVSFSPFPPSAVAPPATSALAATTSTSPSPGTSTPTATTPLVPVAPSMTDVPPNPSDGRGPLLRIDPAGPYADRQVVNVTGTGFEPWDTIGGRLGICPAELDTAKQERCMYPNAMDRSTTVGADGTFTTSIELRADNPGGWPNCRTPAGCVLAWVPAAKSILTSIPLTFKP